MTNKNFLKLCTVSLGLLFLTAPSWSAAQFEMGFQLGSMNPDQDVLVQQTFGSGFNFDFYMGALTDSGFEYRFDIEAYSVGSHHPADVGLNRTLTIVPLEANLIYNFFGKSALRPYVGVGAGCYFYKLSQTFFPNLNSGVVFAPNVILGIKSFLGDEFFLNLEYQRHFVPKIIFNNANDFYLSDISVGMGFAFDLSENNRQTRSKVEPRQKYLYQQNQEETLVEIQQINRELELLNERQKETEDQLSQIYQSSYEDSFAYQNRMRFYEGDRVLVERQRLNAQNRLKVLNTRWVQIRPDKRELNEHIQYLKSNYSSSPYRLRYSGYYLSYTPTYQYRYYQPLKGKENQSRPIEQANPRPVPKPQPTQREKEVYEQKRQEALQQLQERQVIREKETKPIEKIDESRVRDEALEKEKDRVERERTERERVERERLENDRKERERLNNARQEQEQKNKEKAENERKERERVEKEKEEKDKRDKEQKDKENQGNHYGNDKEEHRDKERQNR